MPSWKLKLLNSLIREKRRKNNSGQFKLSLRIQCCFFCFYSEQTFFVWIHTFHSKKWHDHNTFIVKIQVEKYYDPALIYNVTMMRVAINYNANLVSFIYKFSFSFQPTPTSHFLISVYFLKSPPFEPRSSIISLPSLTFCSDPHFSGEGGTIHSTGFFCSVNFGRSIYSSHRIVIGIVKKHIQRRKRN